MCSNAVGRSCPRFSCQKIVLSAELKNEPGIQTCHFPGTPFLFPSFVSFLPSFLIFLSVFLAPFFIPSYPPSYPLRSFIFIEVMLIDNIRGVSCVNILFLLRYPLQHAHHPKLSFPLSPSSWSPLPMSSFSSADHTLFSCVCVLLLKQHRFLIIAANAIALLVLMWAFINETNKKYKVLYVLI